MKSLRNQIWDEGDTIGMIIAKKGIDSPFQDPGIYQIRMRVKELL